MSFTDIFIRRPVLATVVSLLILLVGIQAGFRLQIRQYPELSQTIITVTTTYPGANADVIKGFITTPLEQAVASTEGIDTLVSSSQQNVSTITLNMRLNASPDRAVADVLSKIQQVKSQLPRDALDPGRGETDGPGLCAALSVLQFGLADLLTDHRLSDPCRPAAIADDRWRRQCADSRRRNVCDARVARSGENGGAWRDADPTCAQCAGRPTISRPPPARSRANTPRPASMR